MARFGGSARGRERGRVVRRGDICWTDLGPPAGRRPVCVLTRDAAIDVLDGLACAQVTRTIRGVASEVRVGRREGLPATSVISCDNILTVRKASLDRAVGALDQAKRVELDRALRYALDIAF